jgi:hypothetical protein
MAPKHRAQHRGGPEADEDAETALLVATADSCFSALHAHTGTQMSAQWTIPKTREPLLAFVPLTADGAIAQVPALAALHACVCDSAIAEVPAPCAWHVCKKQRGCCTSAWRSSSTPLARPGWCTGSAHRPRCFRMRVPWHMHPLETAHA